MQYTLEETIQLLKDRIHASSENHKQYRGLFHDAMNRNDIDMANKYHKWMMQELYVLNELRYLFRTITGKEYE